METDNPFEKVLDRLREKGWHKGSYGTQFGPNCLVGGIKIINGLPTTLRMISHPQVELLSNIIYEQFRDRAVDGPMTCVPNFNDHPDTTFPDVERVLEKAAVKWEEERVMRND